MQVDKYVPPRWEGNGVPCSCAGHTITETVYGQMLALRLGDGDEHRALESDMTGLNVKGTFTFTLLHLCSSVQFNDIHSHTSYRYVISISSDETL